MLLRIEVRVAEQGYIPGGTTAFRKKLTNALCSTAATMCANNDAELKGIQVIQAKKSQA